MHVVYPWSDFTKQEGLWETISEDYHNLARYNENESDETYIWIDLTKEETQMLPDNHEFELPSPWILHGVTREVWTQREGRSLGNGSGRAANTRG